MNVSDDGWVNFNNIIELTNKHYAPNKTAELIFNRTDLFEEVMDIP